MAKKILSEAQVRRFAKLANLSPINEMYAKNEEEETVEEGYGMDHKRDDEEVMQEEAEEEVAMGAEMEGGDLPAEDEEAIEMDADGAADVDLSREDVDVLEQAVSILSQITSAAGAEEEPMDDAPMGDDPMDDDPMEEEMIAEALKGINYRPGRKEIVQEVAKRVAKRLLEAKKAEAKMNKALGNKRHTRSQRK
mgnify:CR=1 FL=1